MSIFRLEGSRRAALRVAVAVSVIGLASSLLASCSKGDDPPAGQSDGKNIVFVMTDDQSLESLSRMPYTRRRSDWFRFNNFFYNNPLCCPSRASILTGRYSHHTGLNLNKQTAEFDDSSTIATWLQAAGYRTGLIGKYMNDYPWDRGSYIPPGWDRWAAFSLSEPEQSNYGYYDYTLNIDGELHRYGDEPADYSTDVLGELASDFVSESAEPFFLYLSLKSPHSAFTPAPRHVGRYRDLAIAKPPNFNEAGPGKPAWYRSRPKLSWSSIKRDRRRSYEVLLSADDVVRKLFRALKDRHILKDTVVVFTSDNGYSWGAHRWQTKRCAYEECVKGPLLIRFPGGAPEEVEALTSNVDLAPTVAEIAGVDPAEPTDGRSLLPLLTAEKDAVRSGGVLLRGMRGDKPDGPKGEPPSFWGIRTNRYKYIRHASGEKELYDVIKDPYELENLVRHRKYRAVRQRLAESLAELRSEPPT